MKTGRPLSQCTAKELTEFINKKIPIGERSNWYVMINEHYHTIDCIDPATMEIHSIKASEIYYRAEDDNA